MADASLIPPLSTEVWPIGGVIIRLGMSVGMGIFIGLEREHNRKAGVRTFALTALLGCLGGMMGPLYAGFALGFVAIIILWMNYRQMIKERRLALTTSMALVVTAYAGVLFGEGHRFTPVAAGLLTVALLAWKQPITRFVVGVSEKEIRSAILLAIFTFVVLPVLPDHPVDKWGLVEPRSAWASVILIAGIGFVNYVMLKSMGSRGMEITAFLGGLVNSRKVVVELATRLREIGTSFLPTVHRGLILTTGAMLLRNVVILAILAPGSAAFALIPFGLMMLACVWFWRRLAPTESPPPLDPLSLESPFQFSTALKFGAIFLGINVVGALAQRAFGDGSFYFVSIVGGLLSSASSIAAAANLMARHEISVETGINGVILSGLTSILINIPLLREMTGDAAFKRRAGIMLFTISAAGVLGAVINRLIHPWIPTL